MRFKRAKEKSVSTPRRLCRSIILLHVPVKLRNDFPSFWQNFIACDETQRLSYREVRALEADRSIRGIHPQSFGSLSGARSDRYVHKAPPIIEVKMP